MKIEAYPEIGAHRTRAEKAINAAFAAMTSPLDLVHSYKRQVASAVKSGEEAPAAFKQEATAAGLSAEALADVIIAKPDDVLDREVLRRDLIGKVRSAGTIAEITVIVDPYKHFL
jgi:hypothetical protein